MRKFKHFLGQVAVFGPIAIASFDLQAELCRPIAKLRALARVGGAIDLFQQAQVEQTFFLIAKTRDLPIQLCDPILVGLLGRLALRTKHLGEPIADRLVLDPNPLEHRQDLSFEVRFLHAQSGMVRLVIPATAIVDVVLWPVLRRLRLPLAGDRVAAVIALDEFPGVGQLVTLVDLVAEEGLHAIERAAINQRLVRAAMPLTLMEDFADIGPIAQDRMQLASREAPRARRVVDSFGKQLAAERIDREAVIGVEIEYATDVGGALGIDLDQPASVSSYVGITVRCLADEQPVLNAPLKAVLDVERLLLGVEARHVGERAAHHAACRCVLRRLRDVDDFELVLELQAFELDVVEEIAGRAIDLEEQHAVEFAGMLFRVREQVFEGLPLLRLAGGFGDAEQLDDLAVVLFGVALQR